MTGIEHTYVSDKYGVDLIDGREVPRLIVNGNHTLSGKHQGGVHVELGELELQGTLQGSLVVQTGTRALILGKQQGSVSVHDGATVSVSGAIEGSTHVARGATVLIEPGGRLAGSLLNMGLVIVRGVFGGACSGEGELRLEEDGYIKEPEIRDGCRYYRW